MDGLTAFKLFVFLIGLSLATWIWETFIVLRKKTWAKGKKIIASINLMYLFTIKIVLAWTILWWLVDNVSLILEYGFKIIATIIFQMLWLHFSHKLWVGRLKKERLSKKWLIVLLLWYLSLIFSIFIWKDIILNESMYLILRIFALMISWIGLYNIYVRIDNNSPFVIGPISLVFVTFMKYVDIKIMGLQLGKSFGEVNNALKTGGYLFDNMLSTALSAVPIDGPFILTWLISLAALLFANKKGKSKVIQVAVFFSVYSIAKYTLFAITLTS